MVGIGDIPDRVSAVGGVRPEEVGASVGADGEGSSFPAGIRAISRRNGDIALNVNRPKAGPAIGGVPQQVGVNRRDAVQNAVVRGAAHKGNAVQVSIRPKDWVSDAVSTIRRAICAEAMQGLEAAAVGGNLVDGT